MGLGGKDSSLNLGEGIASQEYSAGPQVIPWNTVNFTSIEYFQLGHRDHRVIGGSGNDGIVDHGGNNCLTGGSGEDMITTYDGYMHKSTLDGGASADTQRNGGQGFTTIIGGDGKDEFVFFLSASNGKSVGEVVDFSQNVGEQLVPDVFGGGAYYWPFFRVQRPEPGPGQGGVDRRQHQPRLCRYRTPSM